MIFHNDTPDTTMDEDLAALGLPTLMEAVQPTSKKLAEAEESPADHVDDDERTEVPVRQDTTEMKHEAPEKSDDAEDDEDDDEEMSEDEIRMHLYQLAAENGVEEDDFPAFVAWLDEENNTNLSALFEDGDEEEGDEDEDEDEDEEDAEEKTEAALAVLDAFYNHLAEMTEDDDEDAPSYDNLVGVIEAYEHLVMDEGFLSGMKNVARRAGEIIRGKAAKMMHAISSLRSKNKGKKIVRTGSGRAVVRGVVPAGKRRKSRIAGRKAHRGGAEAKQRRSARKTRNADVNIDSSAALAELDTHLDDIRSTLSEAEIVEMVENVSTELLEGLKAVHDGATGYYEAIAEELNEEDEAIDEDDSRVAMGRHLESIANDAFRVAELVSEGEADLEDAADDLQSLAADLDDALEAMKGIE